MNELPTAPELERLIIDMPKQIKTQTLFTAGLAAEVETLRLKISKTTAAEMQTMADNPANKNADMRKAALEAALKDNADYLKNIGELKIKEQTLNVNRTHLEYLHNLFSAYKAVAGIRAVR